MLEENLSYKIGKS